MEEIVMAIKTRKDYSFFTDVNTKEIVQSSRFLSAITGFAVQFNKAIVGANDLLMKAVSSRWDAKT